MTRFSSLPVWGWRQYRSVDIDRTPRLVVLTGGMCQGSCRLRYAACPAEDESRSRFKKTLPIGCQLRVDFDQRSGRSLRA